MTTVVVRESVMHSVVINTPKGQQIFTVCSSRPEAEALVARLGGYGAWADVDLARPGDVAGLPRRASP